MRPALAFALLAAGCSTSGLGVDDAAVAPDLTVGNSYPAGPYGAMKGDTLADITGQGYALSPSQTDSTQLTLMQLKLSDLRNNPACKCVLVELNETCGPCSNGEAGMVAGVNAFPSLCVFELFYPFGQFDADLGVAEAATKADLDTWTQSNHENFPVIMGTPDNFILLGRPSAFPWYVTVNPSTMKVLDTLGGYTADPMTGTVARARSECSM
jgi:hypothetical protein